MKKFKLILSIIGLFTASVFAQNNCTLEIGMVDISGLNPGETVNVPVTMPEVDGVVMGWEFYILFDNTVFSYDGNFLQNKTPLFPGSWFENINEEVEPGLNQFAANWLDPNFVGVTVPSDEVLFELQLIYEGGLNAGEQADLVWNFTNYKANNYQMKGVTAVVNGSFGFYDITAMDGGVFLPVAVAMWNGSVSSDWFDSGNWDGGIIPDAVTDAVIPFGTPNDPVIVTNDILPEVAVAANLQMDAATMIVGPLGYLTVTGTLTNNGFIGVISDATNSGSFIYDGPVGGTFNYWRFLSTGVGTPTSGWHYMSSPVPGFGSNNILDYYLNAWDEATSNWVQIVGSEPCVPAPEVFMDGMVGWSLKWDDAYACPTPGTGDVVEFVGAPNFGDQFGAVSASGVGLYPNFNLAGNPYPSYWDYDAFFFGPNFAAANIFDAIYYWDEDLEQYASYVNGLGTNGGSNFVPPAQGFFFEAFAAGTLTYTSAEQAHVIGLPYWKTTTDVVRLTAIANERADETVIQFTENSTVNRDNNDARKLISTAPASPNLYTMADNIDISINHMPATESVPVYYVCETSGSVTIEATETSEFQNVVLEDKLLGIQTDLLTSAYTFDYSAGESADRFLLHFTPLGTPELEANSIQIWSSDKKIFVQAPQINGDIAVYNMMGQEVVRAEIEPGLNVIPMSEVNAYFVVKVLTSKNAVTEKVFVK